MLYTFSIPITDYRPFLCEETFRINIEQFPRNWHDQSFLRSFGKFGERYNTGADIPFFEKKYAKGNNGLRFANQNAVKIRGTHFAPVCVFRRVFFDSASARFDVGITDVSNDSHQTGNKVQDINVFCKYYINKSVFLTGFAQEEPQPLYLIGPALCQKYLYATTLKPSINFINAKSTWLSYGRPIIVSKHEYDELGPISNIDKRFEKQGFQKSPCVPEEWGISLWQRRVFKGIPLYVIVVSSRGDKDKARALRINLLKYHQERESLLAIIKLLARSGQELEGINIDYLSSYLNEITSLYSRNKRDGISQKPFFALMAEIEEKFNQDDCLLMCSIIENTPKLQYLNNRVKTTIKYIFNVEGDYVENQYKANQVGIQGPNGTNTGTIIMNDYSNSDMTYDYQKLKEEVLQLKSI